MSDDLIKRSDAIEAVENVTWYHQNRNKDMVEGANSDEHQAWYKSQDIYEALEALPSADRPQGEWIGCRHEDSEWLSPMADFYKCSICGKIVNLLQMRSYNFCPNCGSRMSKGADDERHDI